MAWSFLKCDAEGCDHKEDVDGLSADMIGKPCPKCGANLLTEKDYKQGIAVEAMMKVFMDAGLLKPMAEGDEQKVVSLTINPHAGAMNIKIEGLK